MITFLHVGSQPWAEKMVASAKITGEPIVQLTDHKTAAVPGVDRVIRRQWNGRHLMLFRMEHLAAIDEEHLTCDADVIFKQVSQ